MPRLRGALLRSARQAGKCTIAHRLYETCAYEIEASSSKKPQEDIHQVRPPSNHQPPLADQKESPVEEKQGQLDPGEGRRREDHGYPNVSEGIGEVSGIVGVLGVDAPGV